MDKAETLLKAFDKKINNKKPNPNPDKTTKTSNTKIITVASGKGGVGKTNLSINLAIAFSRMGKEVVVMDADLGLANVNVILGVVPKYNLYNVLKGQKRLKDIIIDTPEGIKIIAGASGFYQLASLGEEQKKIFLDEIEELSFADIIIIDTGAGVHENVMSFVVAADEIIIITTPEPTSITDAYGIIKAISSRNRDFKINLIVNRAPDLVEGKRVADRIINIAKQFLHITVDYLGIIYDDPIVSQSVIKQKPFIIMAPKSKASTCIEHICLKLEDIKVPDKEGSVKKFLKSFFSLYKEN